MPFNLNIEVNIEKIVVINFFEYERNFAYSGEMHDFWEVIYSDKDYLSVTVRSKEEVIPLGHYRIIAPMELHSAKPAYGKAANAVIFSIVCNNEKLFRDSLGFGAMDYFSCCKIDCAKHLICEKEMNLAEISDYLCFSSQQYFSRRFKNIAGMTPSEYMQSVVNS